MKDLLNRDAVSQKLHRMVREKWRGHKLIGVSVPDALRQRQGAYKLTIVEAGGLKGQSARGDIKSKSTQSRVKLKRVNTRSFAKKK